MADNFIQRKKDVLMKSDKSSKSKWDERIAGLCKKINSLENYYTTSSCSGRVVLMVNQDKKEEDLFLSVYHDEISMDEIKKQLNLVIHPHHQAPNSQVHSLMDYPVNLLATHPKEKKFVNDETKLRVSNNKRDNIKFKFEPCIIHIACKDLKNAQKIYERGKLAGWKRSGIIGMRNGFTVELNSTEKMEFPIIFNKKILVGDEFLKVVVKEANKKLRKSWERIKRLEKII